MAGITYTGRLGSDQFVQANELQRSGRAIGIRAAHLLCKASVIALGCSIVAQPALAQSSVTAQQAGQGFVPADETAAPGALPAAPLPGQAQDKPNGSDAQADDITVTGSRIITNNLNSPTPITTVNVAELAKTTPSDLADGLNKLPQIIGGRTPRNQGNASTNNGGNTLSLRNLGPTRTLVLLNGHRVPASNQDGSVNIDTLPQMLVSRVDIVTGGASAVYGSDAVAGVVNFILDKKFKGLSVKADAGISKYGDGEEWQFGAAWGTDLFGGRGHFEVSGRYRKQALIPISARPYGENGQAWLLAGNGKTDNPYVNVPYSRVFNSGQFGNVQCGTSCAYNNYTFNTAGVLSPMVHGIPTGTTNLESGGDGSYVKNGTFRSEIEMKDVFARLSYDLSSDVNAYIQGSWAESGNKSNWITWVVSPSASRPNTLFANNPFLAATTQQQLGASIVCGTPAAAGWRCLPAVPATSPQTGTTPPPPPTTPYFSAPSYIWNKVAGEDSRDTNRLYRTEALQRNINMELGFTGSLGGFKWDAFYSHGESRLKVTNPNNTDNAKYLASLDAVIAPPGTTVNGVNVAGTIVCWVTTQPQFAGLYPGCVPTNITDPNGPSLGAYNYLKVSTSWVLTQKMDDIGGSIGGDIGFGLPAGHIRANISGDLRWNTYKMESDFRPTDFVDCTGLRMCLANGGAPVRWVQNTNAPVDVSNNVYEIAGEVNIPLLKNSPIAQDVSATLAGRYSKYSTFSAAKTWKAGLDWHVDDSIAFRGTLSLDIRAPNLNDLYQPSGVSSTGFTDALNNRTDSLRLVSRGNPNLTPEKARTLTLGVVFKPSFIPGFGLSIDYYRTTIRDAITQISYASAPIQAICNNSQPKFDSPFCSLVTRPITDPTDPNYTKAVNFPTEIRNSPLNASIQKTKGLEVQFDYHFDTQNLVSWLPGHVSIRHLLGYQPVNDTVSIPGTFPTWAVAPKVRQTTFVSYENKAWSLSLQNQWLSGIDMANSDNAINGLPSTPGGTQHYVIPRLPAYDVLDGTISARIHWLGGEGQVFLTVNNIFNTRAPLYPSGSGIPGLFYPTLPFHDDMGRFFTTGFKAKF